MWKPQQPRWTLTQANRGELQLLGTLWNLNFSEWNLYVEPCGTWTFQNGTFMWNLMEPELLTVEPL